MILFADTTSPRRGDGNRAEVIDLATFLPSARSRSLVGPSVAGSQFFNPDLPASLVHRLEIFLLCGKENLSEFDSWTG